MNSTIPSNADSALLGWVKERNHLHKRPVKNSTKPVEVGVYVWPIAIISLDERNQQFNMVLWLFVHWQNEFSIWQPEEFDGLKHILVASTSMWKPDVYMYNSEEEFGGSFYESDRRLRVRYDGDVSWPLAGKTATICPMQMTYFPFDEQTCTMRLGIWQNPTQYVRIRTAESNQGEYTSNNAWDLMNVTCTAQDEAYGTGNFSTVNVRFHLKRRSEYIIGNILIPCLVISALCPLVFVLPVASGERVSLGVTMLLSYSVFLLIVAENVPKTSDLPLLSKYLIADLGLACTSIAMSVFVICIQHNEGKKRVPAWVRVLLLKGLAKILCFNTHGVANEVAEEVGVKAIETGEGEGSDVTDQEGIQQEINDGVAPRDKVCSGTCFTSLNEWHLLANVLDRLFILIYLITTLLSCAVMLGVILNARK